MKEEEPSKQVEELKKKVVDIGEAGSPLYMQRHSKVVDIIKKKISVGFEIKKVADFGCAELSFFRFLKTIPELEEFSGIDINADVMEMNKCRVSPLAYDYLIRRINPLMIHLFSGSVAEKDARLLGYDAVTCIELIEHLEQHILEKLPETIFGYIKPKVVIFTTPNADFNVLFPDLKGFRHWDHKFEWTREEFKEWCQNVVKKYPYYKFTLSGIGEGPKGTEALGCCSQMAVFTKMKESSSSSEKEAIITPYRLWEIWCFRIAEIIYPYQEHKPDLEEELYLQAVYCLQKLGKEYLFEHYEETKAIISLKQILDFTKVKDICQDINLLRDLLIKNGWEIIDNTVEDEIGAVFQLNELESSDESEDDYEFTQNQTEESYQHMTAETPEVWDI